MIGWPDCTIYDQTPAMSEGFTQGELLRLWREQQGMSLEEVADRVDGLAADLGIPRTGKKLPRTHASMSRWETGKSDVKEAGLRLIAAAYGVTIDELRRLPPLRHERRSAG